VIVTSFAGDFVGNCMSSCIDYRALNFVPSSFNTFIRDAVSGSFVLRKLLS
jgi:hypothetical protein